MSSVKVTVRKGLSASGGGQRESVPVVSLHDSSGTQQGERL